MLEVKNVSYSYGDNKAVDNLSFTVKPGEIFGILGANGGGKTTTFRMIVTLLTPDEGEISYFGKPLTKEQTDEIGYLIEERSLMSKTIVKDLAEFYGGLKGLSRQTSNERLDYWLKRFDIESYKNEKIEKLSKGNQQKIQFILSIINNPKLLVLDEPFSGLDVINEKIFIDIINQFRDQGSMIIFSSHQLDDVESFCENIVILLEGETVLQGPIKEIKKNFKKKLIRLDADNIDFNELKAIEGVYEVVTFENEIEVKIESDEVAPKVFEYIQTLDEVRLYKVEDAKLSDIFIDTVERLNEKD